MAIKDFAAKMSLFCKAGSTPGLDGLSANFHDANHGLSNMEAGAEKVLNTSADNTRNFDGPMR